LRQDSSRLSLIRIDGRIVSRKNLQRFLVQTQSGVLRGNIQNAVRVSRQMWQVRNIEFFEYERTRRKAAKHLFRLVCGKFGFSPGIEYSDLLFRSAQIIGRGLSALGYQVFRPFQVIVPSVHLGEPQRRRGAVQRGAHRSLKCVYCRAFVPERFFRDSEIVGNLRIGRIALVRRCQSWRSFFKPFQPASRRPADLSSS